MATVQLDGIKTTYQVTGNGTPLLLLAPGGFDSTIAKWGSGRNSTWKPLDPLNSLADEFKVIAYDRRDNQDGKLLDEWKQFGRPSGIFIDRNDTLYVADHASTPKNNPGFKRGVRIGSAKDGVVKSFIPGLGADPDGLIVGESVAADHQGNVYWAETSGGMTVRKFVRK